MTNFLAVFCDNHLSLFMKQGPNLCIWAAFSHRFPCSIDHFLSLGDFRKLAVSTVRVSRDTKTNSFSHKFPCSIERDGQRRLTDRHTFRTAVIGVLSVCFGAQLAERSVVYVQVRWRGKVGEGTLGVAELIDDRVVGLITCEGVGDVVGVVTPLGGVAQVGLHGVKVVEVGVVLRVHQDRGEEEDGEGQVEVEREESEVKENRTCMTMEWSEDSRTTWANEVRVWHNIRTRRRLRALRAVLTRAACACRGLRHCACWCSLCHDCWPHRSCWCCSCCRYSFRSDFRSHFSVVEMYSLQFLPFSFCFDLFQQNISFLSHSHCFQHFQKQNPFSPDIWSHFWYSLLTKKSPCSNFHFDRSHSYTYVSRFFFYLLTLLSCFHSFVCTLLMFPLSLSTFLIVTLLFLLPNTFFKKKKHSLPFIVGKPSCFFSVSFVISSFLSFCETLQLFFSFLVSPFFFVAFSNLVHPKNKNFRIKKNLFLTSPKLFSEFPLGLRKNLKNCSFKHSFYDVSGRLRKCIFHFCLFWKTSFSFWWKMGKTKTQVFPDLLVGILPCLQKNLSFHPHQKKKSSWIETQKRVNREGKEVKPKREEIKTGGQKEQQKNEYKKHKYVSTNVLYETQRWFFGGRRNIQDEIRKRKEFFWTSYN